MKRYVFFSALLFTACTSSVREDVPDEPISTLENDQPDLDDQPQVIASTSDDTITIKGSVDIVEPAANDVSAYNYTTILHENGWGYQIYEGQQLIIDQKHIPAIQGINGFYSSEKAATTAAYLITQIEKGVFPPTVTKEVLDSLQVL